jgi:hypothetical protein
MPPLTALPLVSGAPPNGYGWPDCDEVSSKSGTTVFQTGIDQRDRFLGEQRCIICGKGGPLSIGLKQSHIIPYSEEHFVSQVGYTYPFSKADIRHSGWTLKTMARYLNMLKSNHIMNHAMAFCFVETTNLPSIDMHFSFVSSLMYCISQLHKPLEFC